MKDYFDSYLNSTKPNTEQKPTPQEFYDKNTLLNISKNVKAQWNMYKNQKDVGKDTPQFNSVMDDYSNVAEVKPERPKKKRRKRKQRKQR